MWKPVKGIGGLGGAGRDWGTSSALGVGCHSWGEGTAMQETGARAWSLRATPQGSAGCGDTGPGACGCSGAAGRVTAAGPPLTAHVAAPRAAAACRAAAAAASAAAELHTGRERERPARWPRPGSRGPARARLPTRNQNTLASRGSRVAGKRPGASQDKRFILPSQEEDIRPN